MCNKRRFVCIFKVNFKTLISFTFAFLTTAAHVDPLPHLFGVFIYLCIYLFIYLLFLNLFMAVLGLHFCVRAFSSCSKRGPLFIAVRGPHYRGVSCCGAQAPDARAQQLWLTGLVALQHVGSSQTRAQTRVPCIGRQILNHCATREARGGHSSSRCAGLYRGLSYCGAQALDAQAQ